MLETNQNYNDAIIGGIVKDRDISENMINKGYGAKLTKFRWIPYKEVVGTVNKREIYYTEGQSGRGVLFLVKVYEILRKHFYILWPIWFIIWLTDIIFLLFIRVLPNGTHILRTIKSIRLQNI